MKKLISYLILAIMTLGNFSFVQATTFEDNLIDSYSGDDLSLGRCLYKGNTEFSLFINSVIVLDGFVANYLGSFYDVFFKNQCHANDIMSLIRQRDKLRDYIRDAFLTCKTDRIPALKKGFYDINAEIYYVRNIVSSSLALNLPYSSLSTQALYDAEGLFTSESKLKQDMRGNYVDSGIYSPIEFEALFNKLTVKYDKRKLSYVNCETTSWDEVETKWNEFIDTAGGLAPAWKSFSRGVGGRWEKIVEATTDQGFEDYAAGFFGMRVNGLNPGQGFGEILDELYTYNPFPTKSDALKAVGNARKSYDMNRLQTDLSAEFEILYKETGDTAVEMFVEELELLNISIEDSIPLLEGVEGCARTMDSRQCSN